jgi:hypothetical protein
MVERRRVTSGEVAEPGQEAQLGRHGTEAEEAAEGEGAYGPQWASLGRLWGIAAWVKRLVRWLMRTVFPGAVSEPSTVRGQLFAAITTAAGGRPRVDESDWTMPAGAAAVAARLRATRAPATERAARSALRQLEGFLRENTELAQRANRLTPTVWDAVMEAFLVAKVDPPQPHGWRRPQGWGRVTPSTGGAAVGAAMSALSRLGYGPVVWPRTRAMRRALGCDDPDDVVRVEPIFAWEVWRGVRSLGARGSRLSLWELAARALVVLGMVCGGRTGSVTRLLVEQVAETDDARVLVLRPRVVRGQPAMREKQQHARASMRGRRGASVPLTLEHWALDVAVRPWLAVLRRWRAVGTQYLFPSLVRQSGTGASSAGGRPVEGGLWMDPARPWSARAVRAALRLLLGTEEDRTWQGLRVGCNLELRRVGAGDVTRRTLQGRSVRPQLGSEVAYVESFVEDCRSLTRRLGELRVERVAGQLATTATSRSAAEEDDWQLVDVARPLSLDPVSSSSEGGEGSDSDPRVVDGQECGRCFRRLGVRDEGWCCDAAGCTWGVCLACHSGGRRAPLWCPRHAP